MRRVGTHVREEEEVSSRTISVCLAVCGSLVWAERVWFRFTIATLVPRHGATNPLTTTVNRDDRGHSISFYIHDTHVPNFICSQALSEVDRLGFVRQVEMRPVSTGGGTSPEALPQAGVAAPECWARSLDPNGVFWLLFLVPPHWRRHSVRIHTEPALLPPSLAAPPVLPNTHPVLLPWAPMRQPDTSGSVLGAPALRLPRVSEVRSCRVLSDSARPV